MAKPVLFSPEQVEGFLHAMAAFRQPGAYEPGRWCVGNLNRRQDVTGALPDSIVLRDISLRTMEQMPGVVRTEEERASLLRDLVSAGVPEVNTSGFLRQRTLEQMQAEVATTKQASEACQLVYLGPVTPDDFALAARAGYDYVQLLSAYLGDATAVVAGPTYHRIWHDRPWETLRFAQSPAEQIARSVRLTKLALDQGLKVSAGMNMVAYATETYIQDYCGAVSEAGAQEVCLLDSSSGLGPEAFAHIVRLAVAAAGRCRIAVHAHDMFGLGVMSGIAAVKAGAAVVEVAVNGCVIGPAQADLAATAVAFEALYGVRTGVDLGRLSHLSRTVEKLTGVAVAPNYPVTGPELFALGEPDQYVEEVDIDPLLHKPITPELVGSERPLFITATTGPFGMWRKLDQLGVEADKADVTPTLHACWSFMREHRRAIRDEEIVRIAREVIAARAASAKAV